MEFIEKLVKLIKKEMGYRSVRKELSRQLSANAVRPA